MSQNDKFGYSPGPYKIIEPEPIQIKLRNAGFNLEDAPKDFQPGDAIDMSNIRLERQGIAPEYETIRFPTGASDPLDSSAVLHVTSFEKEDKTKIVVAMKADKWEFFLGSQFVPVLGSVGGLPRLRMYATVMDNKLIVANGFTRLKSWDGGAANLVVDLSAEAPRAKFVTRIGQRLLVANSTFTVGADLNQDEVSWSADGDIAEWTDVAAGAGTVRLKPEGTPSVANNITGLSNIERGTLLYRQRSLVLCSRTGIRIAPFRFATIDFTHGTESPYSIASGGPLIGDFFLGHDFVVYHFDGRGDPVPVGLPIQERLEERLINVEDCVGFINPTTMEYCLLSPTRLAEPPVLGDMHVFSIKNYLREKKMSWRYRPLENRVTTAAHVPRVATSQVPFVDSLNSILDVVDPTSPPTYEGSIIPVEVASTLGRPMGIVNAFSSSKVMKPNTGIFSYHTSSDSATPDAAGEQPRIIERIRATRLLGKKMVLQLTSGAHELYTNPKPGGGTVFDAPNWNFTTDSGSIVGSKWANHLDAYNTSAIKTEIGLGITDSTILNYDILDEPQHSSWGGVISKKLLDAMATYAKNMFPGLNIGVSIRYDYRPSERFKVVDSITPQFIQAWELASQWGSIENWRDANLAQAALDGVRVMFSMNIANGGSIVGAPNCPIGPTGGNSFDAGRCLMGNTVYAGGTISGVAFRAYPEGQLVTYATALMAADAFGRSGAAINMWSYEPKAIMTAYMADSVNQAAFATIKSRLDVLPTIPLSRP